MIGIPLRNGSANAHQRFAMLLGDNFLNFEVDFISYIDTPQWSINIYRDGTPLVLGAMLAPGADVIANFDAGIGSIVFVGDEPTIDNLGIANNLVWMQS